MAFQRYGQHDQSYICDTLEDLKSLPNLNMGSTCYVIAKAAKYMINSKGEWIAQTGNKVPTSEGNNVDLTSYATEEYVNNAIGAIEIPSIEGLASEEYVNNTIAAIEVPSVEGLASINYVDTALAEINPVKDVYGDAHAFGLMVDASENKTLIEAMLEKGKVGMYNFHVEKGCPGQPDEVMAKNSSCRGIACVDTYRSNTNWYGWIVMFDQDGEMYTQYIRNAKPTGWSHYKKESAIAVVNCTQYGLTFENGSTGDVGIFDEINTIHAKGQTCYLKGWFELEGNLEVAISGYEYDGDTLMGVCLSGVMVEASSGQMVNMSGVIARTNGTATCYMTSNKIGTVV